MIFNFDLHRYDEDWTKIKLTDKSPCTTCENRINIKQLRPGIIIASSDKCDNCLDRWQYIINCIMKLAWYERKEVKN